jgi:GntR family transcriptional repressor for pyruvate dehydrogenase complex
LVDQVTSQVLAHIRENNLGAGSRLPTTSDMAASLGVAPTTLREALSRLEVTGVIVVRHGVGVFVKSDASRLVLLNPGRVPAGGERLVQLVDARRLLEPALAERAARSRTDGQLEEMARLLEESEHLRAERQKAGQANMAFHAQIGQAAGNQVLADMLSAILELHVEDQLEIDRIVADPARDHAEHCAIFRAVRRHDGRRAHLLMQRHLDAVLCSVTGERPGQERCAGRASEEGGDGKAGVKE